MDDTEYRRAVGNIYAGASSGSVPATRTIKNLQSLLYNLAGDPARNGEKIGQIKSALGSFSGRNHGKALSTLSAV